MKKSLLFLMMLFVSVFTLASCGNDKKENKPTDEKTEETTPEETKCEHTFSEWTVSKAATCTEKGEETRTCSKCGEKETRATNALGHDWAEATYKWSEDKTKVTATRVCSRDKGHKEEETVDVKKVTTAATYDKEGLVVYTATFTNKAFSEQRKEEVLPKLEHTYEETPTYVWSEDNKIVTATLKCNEGAEFNIVETANVTEEVTKAATCTEAGSKTLTATFTNDKFSVQTKELEIAKLEHNYIATVVAPTCTEGGYTLHRCSLCNDEYKDSEVLALGHSWGEPTYVWSEDLTSVTAKRVCNRDGEHVETETVQTKLVTDKAPTCVAKGSAHYEATFKNSAFAVQKSEAQELPMGNHTWGDVVYTWNKDYTKLTATRTCANDKSHVETETVNVTKTVVKEATCKEKGTLRYTSAAFENPAFTAKSFEQEIKMGAHTWEEPTYTWSEDNKTVEAKRVCSVCKEEQKETANVISKPLGNGKVVYTATFENPAFATQTKEDVLAGYILVIDGVEYTLEQNPAEGKQNEYMVLGVSVLKGQTLSFIANGEAIVVTGEEDAKNNVTPELVVKNDCVNANVYLKVVDTTYTVFVENTNEPEEQYIELNGERFVNNSAAQNELMLQGVEVKAGEKLEFTSNVLDTVIIAKTDAGNNVNEALEVLTAGTVDLYLAHGEDGNWYLWVTGYVAPTPEEVVIKANGQTLVQNPENEVELMLQGLDANAGLKLEFMINEEVLSVIAKAEAGNNVNEALEVIDGGLVDLYLVKGEDGNYYLWVTGKVIEVPDVIKYGDQVLVQNPENEAELMLQEVEVTAGLKLAFTVNDQPLPVKAKAGEANNVNEALEVIKEGKVGFYLAKDENGEWVLWVTGNEAVQPEKETVTYKGQELVVNPNNETELMLEGLTLNVGDVIEIKVNGEVVIVKAKANEGLNINNIDEKLVVLTSAKEAGLYLAKDENGEWILWVTGYQIDTTDLNFTVNGHKLTLDKGEYKLEDLQLKAGTVLNFEVNGKAIDVVAKPDVDDSVNNVNEKLEVIKDTESCGIYLAVYNDGTYHVWVSGNVKAPAVKEEIKYGEQVLVENPNNKTELMLTGLTLKAGDVIELTKNGENIIVVAKAGEGNNLDAELKVIKDANDAGLYLSKNEKGEWVLWVTGNEVTEPENPETKVVIKYGDQELALDKGEYKLEGLTLNAGDLIELTLNDEKLTYVVKPNDDFNTNNLSAEFKVIEASENAGLYLVKGEDGNWYLWVSGIEQKEPEQPQEKEVKFGETVLTKNEKKNEWYLENVQLTAETKFAFTVNGDDIVVVADPYQGNNVDENLTVKQAGTHSLYLKYENEEWSLWVTGYVEDVTINFGEKVLEKDELGQYVLKGVEVTENEALVFVSGSKTLAVKADPYQGNNVNEALQIVKAGTVDFYLKNIDNEWILWVTGNETAQPENPDQTIEVRFNNQKLELNSENNEYKLEGLKLEAGQLVELTLNGKPLTYIVKPGDEKNVNNLDAAFKVIKGTENGGLYLVRGEDGNWYLWVSGNEVQPETPVEIKFGEEVLVKNPGNENELMLKDVTVDADQTLEFIVNVEGVKVIAKTDAGNNVTAEMKIIKAGTVDFYLAKGDDGNYYLWVTTPQEPITDEIKFGDQTLVKNPGNANELMLENVTVEANATLEFTCAVEGFNVIAKTDAGNNVTTEMKIIKGGTVSFYLAKGENNTWYLWVTTPEAK